MIPFALETGLALAGPLLQYQGQKEANQANITHSVENRDWQERMSSSAYQRSTEDLKKAGLNPMLALGSQASTPSGSVPTVESTTEGLASTALEAQRLFNDIKKQKAEIDLLKSQKTKTDVDATVASKGVPKAELTNEFYDLLRPAVKKIKQSLQSDAPRGASRRENSNDMTNYLNNMKLRLNKNP